MAVYRIKQKKDYNSFHGLWDTRYIIYKKRWYGWSWQAQTGDIEEAKRMADNLIKEGNIVYKHWTLTKDI